MAARVMNRASRNSIKSDEGEHLSGNRQDGGQIYTPANTSLLLLLVSIGARSELVTC